MSEGLLPYQDSFLKAESREEQLLQGGRLYALLSVIDDITRTVGMESRPVFHFRSTRYDNGAVRVEKENAVGFPFYHLSMLRVPLGQSRISNSGVYVATLVGEYGSWMATPKEGTLLVLGINELVEPFVESYQELHTSEDERDFEAIRGFYGHLKGSKNIYEVGSDEVEFEGGAENAIEALDILMNRVCLEASGLLSKEQKN